MPEKKAVKRLPPKKDFRAYQRVQFGGQFNMIAQWTMAARAAGLSPAKYGAVQDNYSALHEKYGRSD